MSNHSPAHQLSVVAVSGSLHVPSKTTALVREILASRTQFPTFEPNVVLAITLTFIVGTFLRGTLRLMLTYKGAIFYKMNAGMGDTIFTPLSSARTAILRPRSPEPTMTMRFEPSAR